MAGGWRPRGQLSKAALVAACAPGATSVSGHCDSRRGRPALGVCGRTLRLRAHCDLPGTELHPGSWSWLLLHLHVPCCQPSCPCGMCHCGRALWRHLRNTLWGPQTACLPCGGHRPLQEHLNTGQTDVLRMRSQLSAGRSRASRDLEAFAVPRAWQSWEGRAPGDQGKALAEHSRRQVGDLGVCNVSIWRLSHLKKFGFGIFCFVCLVLVILVLLKNFTFH